MLDLDVVRARFPALASGFVFFDNAGGSQTLGSVADRVRDYLVTNNVQLGASYAVSRASTERVEAGVAAAAALVGASPGEVVLGSSSTQLLHNLALAMHGELRAGDEVVITSADHEANRGPWRRLAERGVVVKEWALDRDSLRLEARGLEPLLGPKTKLVAFTHVSNLLGSIHDVPALTRLAHEAGAKVVVDGVAFAPHRRVDVAAWGVDYYVLSLYKVYGPHVGLLYGKREHLERLGNLNHDFLAEEVPYKLQPGNVNFELTASLGAIVEYMDSLGGLERAFADVAAHEEALSARLLAYLTQKAGVTVHGDPTPARGRRVPTFAFSVAGREPETIVRAVDPKGIGVRHGDFYARPLARALGCGPGGVVRASAVHYNTLAEVDRLVDALDEAIDRAR